MPNSQGNAVLLPIFGLGAGLLFFYRGLRYYRKTLVVADTPVIPIRSVAMGLAQVHGTAQGEGAFPSPVSGVPCYAYKVQIERYNQHSNRGSWSHYRTDVNGKRFYVEDDTGRVPVDPHSADLDVPRTCRRTVPETTWSMWTDKEADFPATAAGAAGLTVRSDEDLQEFAQGVGGDYNNRYRFTEYCVLPGKEYDVLGTCVENPRPSAPNDRNLITKGQNEETYLISSKAPAQLERSLRWKSALMVWGGVALAGACAALWMAEFGLF
jgi:hypothetical protein